MAFSEAGELEPQEPKQEKLEVKQEALELKETARWVEAATTKPLEVVEKEREIKESEAIEKAATKVVEAQVAIVDQAVEAAAPAVEAPSGKDAEPEPDPAPERDTTPSAGNEETVKTTFSTEPASSSEHTDPMDKPEVPEDPSFSSTVEGSAELSVGIGSDPEQEESPSIDTVPLPEKPEMVEAQIEQVDVKFSGK